jgi:hypothetical protein
VVDLEPAATGVANPIRAVTDEQLGRPTPCPAYSVGDLVDHVGGLSLAFTAAAKKTFGDASVQGPSGDTLFGPVVAVPDDAPLLDRVIGLAGRDPGWRHSSCRSSQLLDESGCEPLLVLLGTPVPVDDEESIELWGHERVDGVDRVVFPEALSE